MYAVDNLSPGSHTLTVEATGRKSASSKGAWIWVDSFEADAASVVTTPPGSAPCRFEQGHPAVEVTGSWSSALSDGHSSRGVAGSVDNGPRATFTFSGNAVRWLATRDAWSGIAEVYIDGALRT